MLNLRTINFHFYLVLLIFTVTSQKHVCVDCRQQINHYSYQDFYEGWNSEMQDQCDLLSDFQNNIDYEALPPKFRFCEFLYQKATFNSNSSIKPANCDSCDQKCVCSTLTECNCLKGFGGQGNKTLNNSTTLLSTVQNGLVKTSISNANISSSFVLMNGTFNITSMDFLHKTGELFWVGKNHFRTAKVFKTSFNSPHDKPLEILSSSEEIFNLVVDWINDHIYWITFVESLARMRIMMSNVTGGKKMTLVTSEQKTMTDLAIDPVQGYLFWSTIDGVLNSTKGGIRRVRLDGSDEQIIVTGIIAAVVPSLTLDHSSGSIYWVNINQIFCSDYNGDGVEMIRDFKTVPLLGDSNLFIVPFHIAVNEDVLFFTNLTGTSVWSIHVFPNSKDDPVPVQLPAQPIDLKVYDTKKQPNGINYCANHKCSHFCLPKVDKNGSLGNNSYTVSKVIISCHCPNSMILLDDQVTCSTIPMDRQVTRTIIPMMPLPSIEYHINVIVLKVGIFIFIASVIGLYIMYRYLMDSKYWHYNPPSYIIFDGIFD